jgi:hypothetical protein
VRVAALGWREGVLIQRVLTADPHDVLGVLALAKFYDITGPQPLSHDEIAVDLGAAMRAAGMAVPAAGLEYRPQDMAVFEDDFGAARAEFVEYLCNGFYTRCSPDFYNLVGRRPITYTEYLTTEGVGGETGLQELWQSNVWKKGDKSVENALKAVGQGQPQSKL